MKCTRGRRTVCAILSIVLLGILVPGTASAEYREITAELQHTFQNGWHTPAWRQIHMLSDHPIGCGPTAWAIVYGYWSAFHGKTGLFDGYNVVANSNQTPPANSPVAVAAGRISNITETNYGGEVTENRFGLTWPRNMCDGIEYAKQKGYPSARCTRIRGSEFEKFDQIKRFLDADKPVILLIRKSESGRRGIPNHYVVIEAAVKKQKQVAGRWQDRDVRYLVNFGHGPHGAGRDWIYTREVGIDDHQVWTSASAFLVDVDGNTPATYTESNQDACEDWCEEHANCAKCSTLRECGRGYRNLRSWTGRGQNWHACEER